MMQDINQKMKIPENVTIEIVNGMIKVKGPKGEIQRKLFHRNIKIAVENKDLVITSKRPTKREKTMAGTFRAHIKNMIKGVTEGFTYQLKVVSTHFPISVAVEGREVVIKNFLGEKIPRKCKIPEGIELKIDGSNIIIESNDIEKAGMMASLIEQTTRITNRDRRVFQDGVYITTKPER